MRAGTTDGVSDLILQDIRDFGGTDADADELLRECFQDHPAFLAARAHARFLVVGRKGSGKAAQKYGITAEQAGDGSPDLAWLVREGKGARPYSPGDGEPTGIRAFSGREPQDMVLWIESHRTVVSGDSLVDFGQGLEIPIQWLWGRLHASRSSRACARFSSCRSSSCSRPTAHRPTGPRSSARSPDARSRSLCSDSNASQTDGATLLEFRALRYPNALGLTTSHGPA